MNAPGLLARRHPRPTPMAPPIILSQNARTDLQAVARAHATPQSLALRARMVCRAAALDRPTNLTIGHEVGCANLTVGTGRRRSLALGFPGLQEAMRSGRPRTMASPTRVQVISVARALPQAQERTGTRWTCDAIVATGRDARHPDSLSRSRIWRILHDGARKPPKRADWLNSPAEDFEANAPPSARWMPRRSTTPPRPSGELRRCKNRHARAGTHRPSHTGTAGATCTACPG